ncbi:GNAT family N-acetyltransferase [Plesiomonas shigelloides]|uniref:GNAT family N-acetyltransferase n=1 Tax=Plesiomonas shigelloides TaxID=703 RepID=UPI0015B59382|nr:GNAT family N-acetyltransferase [Plesiomonas shigelloides]
MTEVNHSLIYQLLIKVDSDFNPPLSLSLDLDEYSKKIASKAILFTCFNDKSIIALCAIYATDKKYSQAYLTLLAVDPAFRGVGLAKKLMSEMEAYVLDAGFKYVKLEVYKTNISALSMYRRLGYEIVEESPNSYFLKKLILHIAE